MTDQERRDRFDVEAADRFCAKFGSDYPPVAGWLRQCIQALRHERERAGKLREVLVKIAPFIPNNAEFGAARYSEHAIAAKAVHDALAADGRTAHE